MSLQFVKGRSFMELRVATEGYIIFNPQIKVALAEFHLCHTLSLEKKTENQNEENNDGKNNIHIVFFIGKSEYGKKDPENRGGNE